MELALTADCLPLLVFAGHFMLLARVALLALVAFVVGCGGSSEPAPVAGQDELQKWVAENPAPPESDGSEISGAVK